MVRKNGLAGLVLVFVLLVAVSSVGVIEAQQSPSPTPHPAAQAAISTPQTPQYAYLGVHLNDTAQGITISGIESDSPASVAGLQPGDILQKFNNASVANVSEFASALALLKPDASVTIDLTRTGKPMTVTAKLGSTNTPVSMAPTNAPFDGISYNASDKSWVVFSLINDGTLHTDGLQIDDVVTKINGMTYAPADFQNFLKGLKTTDQVKFTVQRAGKSMEITTSASAVKALNLFDYSGEGMLFYITPPTINVPSKFNLAGLQNNVPFDVIGFDSSKNAWTIYDIAASSTLADAGLQPNDQITKFNGTAYLPTNLDEFRQKLADADPVKLTVERTGKTMDISVPAGVLNSLHLFNDNTNGMLFGSADNHFGAWLGANTTPLSADVAKQHNLTITQGLLVTDVTSDSPAAMAGLQANDAILTVGTTKIDAQHDLQSLLANYKPGDQITLSIMRADKPMNVQITLAKPDVNGENSALMSAF